MHGKPNGRRRHVQKCSHYNLLLFFLFFCVFYVKYHDISCSIRTYDIVLIQAYSIKKKMFDLQAFKLPFLFYLVCVTAERWTRRMERMESERLSERSRWERRMLFVTCAPDNKYEVKWRIIEWYRVARE